MTTTTMSLLPPVTTPPPSTLPGPAEVATEHALAFMLAGRATFTLQSLKSGLHFSYRLRKTDRPDPRVVGSDIWTVELLTGPSNTTDWLQAGIMHRKGGGLAILREPWWRQGTDSFKALWWTLCRLSEGKPTADLEIHHAGTCGACGRVLTTPESVRRGLGPICAERAG